MQVIQTVAPTQEPITLDEAKKFLRITHANEDNLISSLISTTRELAESYLNRQLEIATFELYTSSLNTDFRLPKNPIKEIISVEYLDDSNIYQVFNSDNYYLYEDSGIGYIHFEELPSYTDNKKAIKITFRSGYDEVPDSIKQWMKVKISSYYENRESIVVGASVSDIGKDLIDGLLNQYRIVPL